jgi:hypothetical protein
MVSCKCFIPGGRGLSSIRRPANHEPRHSGVPCFPHRKGDVGVANLACARGHLSNVKPFFGTLTARCSSDALPLPCLPPLAKLPKATPRQGDRSLEGGGARCSCARTNAKSAAALVDSNSLLNHQIPFHIIPALRPVTPCPFRRRRSPIRRPSIPKRPSFMWRLTTTLAAGRTP